MGKLTKPNPGSPEAVAAGCTCPVIDNHHGKGVPAGKNGAPMFWHSERCPMHGRAALRNHEASE